MAKVLIFTSAQDFFFDKNKARKNKKRKQHKEKHDFITLATKSMQLKLEKKRRRET